MYMQIFFKKLFILREKERERESEEGQGEKEKDRIPSRLRAVSTEPDMGLHVENCEIMTRAKIKSWTPNRLSHPGAPKMF